MSNARSKHHLPLPDTHQSFWDLSVIQLTGVLSLPVLAASVLLIQEYNFISALLSLILGNVALFFIRLVIAFMSYTHRKSTLDISREYLGNIGNYFIAILLLLSTLAWFIVQTTVASNALTYLIPINEGPDINFSVQVSVFLGIVSTLFCMEGIVVLKWLSRIAFPILTIVLIAIFAIAPRPDLIMNWQSISLAGIPLVLAVNLGVTADLPTFFRHSRSWSSSVKALAFIQIVSLAFGIMGLYFGTIINPWFGINQEVVAILHNIPLRTFLTILVFVSAICANVANVYSASVGWELVAPMLATRREYLILGLGLTILFILVVNLFSLNILLEATDTSLVNLCLMLILAYFIHRLYGRAPTIFEKTIYFLGWLIVTLLNTVKLTGLFLEHTSPLTLGLLTVLSAAVIILLWNTFLYVRKCNS